MRNPFSAVLYFRRNAKRAMPVLGIIALAVFGVLMVGIIAQTQLLGGRRDFLGPYELFARVRSEQGVLDSNIAARLRHEPAVDRVIGVMNQSIQDYTLMGSTVKLAVGMSPADMPYFLDRMGLSVMEGRLPIGSRNEIALHDALMKKKGLQIGSKIGDKVDQNEWLPGEYVVVGRLEGDIRLGVVPIGAFRNTLGTKTVGDTDLLIFPKPGQMSSVDAYVRPFQSKEVRAMTITTQSASWLNEVASASTLTWSINAVTIFVLSIAVGLLNTIYFMQRINEYGVLAALGLRRSFLIRKTLVEALTLTMAGWLVGLGLTLIGNWIMRAYIFGPKGIDFSTITTSIAASTLPIPILIVVFSLVTVVRRLIALDPVSIVERRD